MCKSYNLLTKILRNFRNVYKIFVNLQKCGKVRRILESFFKKNPEIFCKSLEIVQIKIKKLLMIREFTTLIVFKQHTCLYNYRDKNPSFTECLVFLFKLF